MLVGRIVMENSDVRRATIDFTQWLDTAETITSIVRTVSSVGTSGWSSAPIPTQLPYDPTPLEVRSSQIVADNTKVQLFIDSGTPGNVYTVTVEVLGSSLRQVTVELQVQISGTPPAPPPIVPTPVDLTALSIEGGTMEGPLYLFEDPITAGEAVTKRYADAFFVVTNTAITTEATLRGQADDTIVGDLATEQARASAAESTLTTNLAAETTRAEAAEATNATAITSEATTRASADTTLTTNLAAEVTRAEAAEALKATITSLNTEIARAEAAEAANAAAIAAEITRAEAAEALKATITSLNSEITRAEAAEATNAAAIAAEITRAEAAEAALGGSTTAGVRAGSATTDGSGILSVNYSTPFSTDTVHVALGGNSGFIGLANGFFASNLTLNTTFTSANGFTAFLYEPDPATGTFAIAVPGTTVKWYAIGY